VYFYFQWKFFACATLVLTGIVLTRLPAITFYQKCRTKDHDPYKTQPTPGVWRSDVTEMTSLQARYVPTFSSVVCVLWDGIRIAISPQGVLIPKYFYTSLSYRFTSHSQLFSPSLRLVATVGIGPSNSYKYMRYPVIDLQISLSPE
jgi:hypothetical protein